MKNIVVFGELPIATKIVEFIQQLEYANVPCVVCENYNAKSADPWDNVPMLFDYAGDEGIPVLGMEELSEFCKKNNLNPDVGITARFSKILKTPHINLFKHGVINLHGGLLPEFGGLYSVNHMLLSGVEFGGGSLHWVDLGIDTGDLIKRCICVIDDDDTAFTLHQKVQLALFKGICDLIIEGCKNGFDNLKRESAPATATANYYSRDSLCGLKEIKPEHLFSESSLRIIRAFDFPGHEPAYTFINNKKVELRYGG